MDSFASKAIMFPLVALLVVFLTTGCSGGGRNGRLPASTGQPYEVVLEGDTDSILTKILSEDVPGLPQSEPLCDLIQVKRGKVKGSYQMVRTRIVVNIDPQCKGFSAKTTHDENASPQTVIRIKAKSAEQLRAMNGSLLRSIIDQSELKHLASVIQQNPAKQREVKRMFGLSMKIPASLDASKKAKDFLWLSNNASSGMQNLIFMKVKSEERRVKNGGRRAESSFTNIKSQVDSILRKNMLGETDEMYMTLSAPTLEGRGLWEMKGDAMGGPYVMKVFHATKGGGTQKGAVKDKGAVAQKEGYKIVVIAFVYAPEMKKRNLTKQLEAMLSTISLPKGQGERH